MGLNLWPHPAGARVCTPGTGVSLSAAMPQAGLTADCPWRPWSAISCWTTAGGTLPRRHPGRCGHRVSCCPPSPAYTYRLQRGMNLYNNRLCLRPGRPFLIVPAHECPRGGAGRCSTRWAIRAARCPCCCCLFGLCAPPAARRALPVRPSCPAPPCAGIAHIAAHQRPAPPADYLVRFGPRPRRSSTWAPTGVIALGFLLCTGGDLNGPNLGCHPDHLGLLGPMASTRATCSL